MFYGHFVLAKKGPLARIWLAAHWDKKLTKAHVFETNIESSVDGILQPKVKMALRTSGHLLLGVVRIYSRKAKYLLADCNEAFVKIKMAFRPGMVDLPEEHREAAMNAITLPEVFHDFNTAMTDLTDIDIEAQFSLNQSRADEITMREDYGTLQLVAHDEGFGDMGFDTDGPDIIRDAVTGDVSLEQSNLLFSDGISMTADLDRTKEPIPGTSGLSASRSALEIVGESHIHDDGFGGTIGDDFEHAGGLFEGDLFSDVAPAASALAGDSLEGAPPHLPVESDEDDMGDHYVEAPSPTHSSDDSRPPSLMHSPVRSPRPTSTAPEIHVEAPTSPQLMPPPLSAPLSVTAAIPGSPEQVSETLPEQPVPETIDQTTLLQNEEESFALAPVDASALKGITKAKRKRKLVVDEVKNISGEEMKNQLSDTTDIVTTLDLAPPTKRLMHWKETGGVEKLFALPSRHIPARALFKNYQRHLTSRAFENEDFSALGPDIIVPEQVYQPEEIPLDTSNVAKRVTRKRKYPSDTAPETKTPQHTVQDSELEVEQEPDIPTPIPLLPPTPIVKTPEPEPLLETMPPPELPAGPIEHVIESLVEQLPVIQGLPGLLPLPMTPGLHGIMTPGDLAHGLSMTPAGLEHGGLSPGDLVHGHGMPMTPGHTSVHVSMEVDMSLITPLAEPEPSLLEEVPVPSYISDMAPLGYDQQGQPMLMANMGYDEQAMGSHTPRAPASERVATPWHEDYEFPASVGHNAEEQLQDETDEQFEERVLNKRAAQMFNTVRGKLLKENRHLYLSDIARNNNRKQAAQKFYSLLVLKKFQVLEISQEEPCGDILVTKGLKFENPSM